MFKKILAAAAVLLLAGCAVVTKPCPEACPPGAVCVGGLCVPIPCPDGQHFDEMKGQCVQDEVTCSDGLPSYEGQCPATCADLACPYGCDESVRPNVCKPKPPEVPKTCADLSCPYGCDENPDGAVCRPKPPVEPPPPAVVLIPDEELSAKAGDARPLTWADVWSALQTDVAANPNRYDMNRGGLSAADQVAGSWGPAINAAYDRIASLLANGSASSINRNGARSDCLFSRRGTSNEYEEVHLFEYGGGRYATGPGAVKGVYVRNEVPAAEACPFSPCPARAYDDGRPRWKYNAKQHTMGNGDSTPVVKDQLDFCRAIGLGEYNGAPRASCPVRPDGHPERVAVEAWLLEGGPTRDSRNGQDCSPNHTDNPAAFLFGTGNCRMCNAPKSVCSEWM